MYLKGLILFKKIHIILLLIFSLLIFNSSVYSSFICLKSGKADLKQETEQAEYNKHIYRGDSLMNLKKYDKAMIEY